MTHPVRQEGPLTALQPSSTVEEAIGSAVVPWRYGTVGSEYEAIRNGIGVIDLTGAGLWHLSGPGAVDYLQSVFSRDVAYLTAERSTMGIVLDDDGTPLDICTAYRVEDGFLVETSVGRAGSARLAEDAPVDVEVVDVRDELVLIGFEGPRAWVGAAALLDDVIDGLPFQGVRRVHAGGTEMMVARSGVSGEFGFKVAAPVDAAGDVWRQLCTTGEPCGHKAVEIAMTEIRQPLLHRELLDDGTVLRCGLNWLLDFDKEQFRGREAVTAAWEAGPDQLPVSFVGASDGAGVPQPGAEVMSGTERVGKVVHAVESPGLGALCGIARVDHELAASGLGFTVAGDGVELAIRTASSPVTTPTSWRLASQRSS